MRSAGAEGTVVWNVIIGKHRRSRNTCNVKSGRFPVHLGLDHAILICGMRMAAPLQTPYAIIRMTTILVENAGWNLVYV